MSRKIKSTIVMRVLRAGEAFFRTPETEDNQLRRVVAENTVLHSNNEKLTHRLTQVVHMLEAEAASKQHDTAILEQLRKDYAWEKQARIVLEEQLKDKQVKQSEN